VKAAWFVTSKLITNFKVSPFDHAQDLRLAQGRRPDPLGSEPLTPRSSHCFPIYFVYEKIHTLMIIGFHSDLPKIEIGGRKHV